MTDYYVDPAATGSNDGSTWTNAWTDVQTAFDTVTAGNTCYCRGTQTLTSRIDVDTNEGSSTTGRIKFIGCNASGVNDGTAFVIDGNSAVANCLYLSAIGDFVSYINLEVKNATGNGVDGSGSLIGVDVINCSFHDHGGYGFRGYALNLSSHIHRSSFYNNSTHGMYSFRGSSITNSVFRDNTEAGIDFVYASGMLMGNLIVNNGHSGIYRNGTGSLIINNVIDNNGRWGLDLSAGYHGALVYGNRITNHNNVGYGGLNCAVRVQNYGYNYFENNTVNVSGAYANIIKIDGIDTNQYDQSNINEGYVSLAAGSEDYNLRSDATMRRVAIEMKDVI